MARSACCRGRSPRDTVRTSSGASISQQWVFLSSMGAFLTATPSLVVAFPENTLRSNASASKQQGSVPEPVNTFDLTTKQPGMIPRPISLRFRSASALASPVLPTFSPAKGEGWVCANDLSWSRRSNISAPVSSSCSAHIAGWFTCSTNCRLWITACLVSVCVRRFDPERLREPLRMELRCWI